MPAAAATQVRARRSSASTVSSFASSANRSSTDMRMRPTVSGPPISCRPAIAHSVADSPGSSLARSKPGNSVWSSSLERASGIRAMTPTVSTALNARNPEHHQNCRLALASKSSGLIVGR